MLDDSEYTEQELAGLNEWFQLENDRLPQEPFTFCFIKLKSGSPELIELVMEPLETLLGNGSLPALPGVTGESRITTTLFRHDRGLKARLMYFKAAVDSQDDSVSMTGHKARPALRLIAPTVGRGRARRSRRMRVPADSRIRRVPSSAAPAASRWPSPAGAAARRCPRGSASARPAATPSPTPRATTPRPLRPRADPLRDRFRRRAGRPRGPARGSALRTPAGLGPVLRPRELHRPRRVAGPGGGARHPVALLRGGSRDRGALRRHHREVHRRCRGRRVGDARGPRGRCRARRSRRPGDRRRGRRACVARPCRSRWLPGPPSRPASRPSSSAWRTREWSRATS